MIEDLLLALQNFRHNKIRTLLALLGIVIGVCSVVITMNLSSSLQATIANIFKDLNNSVLLISHNKRQNGSFKFDRSYAETIKKYVPGVKQVFLTDSFSAQVIRGNLSSGSQQCFGIDYGYREANRWELEYGSGFSLSDFVNGNKTVIIGEDIAKTLFPEGNAVGKTITLSVTKGRGVPLLFLCTVRGVLKTKITPIGRMNRYILIPRTFMIRSLGRKNIGNMAAVELYETGCDVHAAKEAVEKLSDKIAKQDNAVWIFSSQVLTERIESNLLMISVVLSGIAALSLLIGGVGIMNIMLVTVAERRQEIGIRKAIGANTRAILVQFLTESAAISIIGGLIGLAVGVLFSISAVPLFLKPFTNGEELILSLNVKGALSAFLISASAGIFFGMYPAWQAGKLDPVKALEE